MLFLFTTEFAQKKHCQLLCSIFWLWNKPNHVKYQPDQPEYWWLFMRSVPSDTYPDSRPQGNHIRDNMKTLHSGDSGTHWGIIDRSIWSGFLLLVDDDASVKRYLVYSLLFWGRWNKPKALWHVSNNGDNMSKVRSAHSDLTMLVIFNFLI